MRPAPAPSSPWIWPITTSQKPQEWNETDRSSLITDGQNAYLVKRKQSGGVQFSRDPMNLNNKHARIYEGFVNDKVGNYRRERTVGGTDSASEHGCAALNVRLTIILGHRHPSNPQGWSGDDNQEARIYQQALFFLHRHTVRRARRLPQVSLPPFPPLTYPAAPCGSVCPYDSLLRLVSIGNSVLLSPLPPSAATVPTCVPTLWLVPLLSVKLNAQRRPSQRLSCAAARQRRRRQFKYRLMVVSLCGIEEENGCKLCCRWTVSYTHLTLPTIYSV